MVGKEGGNCLRWLMGSSVLPPGEGAKSVRQITGSVLDVLSIRDYRTKQNMYPITTCPGASLIAQVKNPPADAGDAGSILGSGRFPWRRKWQSTQVFLPGKSHGQRSLAGYIP